jgi:hypothetical protein
MIPPAAAPPKAPIPAPFSRVLMSPPAQPATISESSRDIAVFRLLIFIKPPELEASSRTDVDGFLS